MRFSLVCTSSIALRSTMDQSGSQRTSFQFSIDAYRPSHLSRHLHQCTYTLDGMKARKIRVFP